MFANKPGELPAVPGIPMTIIDSLLPGPDLDVRLLDYLTVLGKQLPDPDVNLGPLLYSYSKNHILFNGG